MPMKYLRVKKAQNGRIKVLTDKQDTTNVPLADVKCENVKMLKEMQQRCF